jgi:hypothetical protein
MKPRRRATHVCLSEVPRAVPRAVRLHPLFAGRTGLGQHKNRSSCKFHQPATGSGAADQSRSLRRTVAEATAPTRAAAAETTKAQRKPPVCSARSPPSRDRSTARPRKRCYCAERRGERPLRRMIAYVGGDDRPEPGHHDAEEEREAPVQGSRPTRTRGQAPMATNPQSNAGRRPMRSESWPSSTPGGDRQPHQAVVERSVWP